MNYILAFCFYLLNVLSSPTPAKVTVYVILAEECPICNFMGETMAQVARDYEGKVNFKAVFPNKRSNYKTAHLFKKQYQLDLYEIIIDKDQALTSTLGATVTPEVVIVRGENEIVYRGRINDAYHSVGKRKNRRPSREFERNVAAALQGKTITTPWPEAIGCFVTFRQDAH